MGHHQSSSPARQHHTDWAPLSLGEIGKSDKLLEEKDRVELAGLLLGQSDEAVEPGWDQAWEREIERRAKELDSGAVKPVSWEDVRSRALQQLDADTPR